MSYCEYDPSGRFIVLGSQDSKSIQIWSALGEQVFRDSMSVGNSIADVCWRPRARRFLDVRAERKLLDDWKVIKKKYANGLCLDMRRLMIGSIIHSSMSMSSRGRRPKHSSWSILRPRERRLPGRFRREMSC